MKETAKICSYFDRLSCDQSLEEQSRECREFALALEIEKSRGKELFERTKNEIEKSRNKNISKNN